AAVTVSRRSSRTLRLRHLPWTFLIVAIAAGLVVWAAYLAHVMPLAGFNYECAALLWAAGVSLAVAALVGPVAPRRIARGGWREAAIVGLLLVVALALRLAGLGQFPDLMSGDEGSMALEAQRIIRGDLLNPFGTGWLSHPNLFFYLEAAALQVLGWNLFGLRFTAAFMGAVGVVAVYFLARETFGRETAWISAAFAAGWGLPLHFSRLALNNSADLFFGAAVMAFLLRGLVRDRRGDFVAAGLALGLSQYFYHGNRLLLPLLLATLLLSGARRLRMRWRGLLVFVIVALLVSGPLLAYFVQRPDVFMDRYSAISRFESEHLVIEQQATGKSLPRLLLGYLGQNVLAFIHTRDVGYFYQPNTPMLLVFSGALFVLGVGLALARWWEVRYQVLLVWIGLTVLFGGWLLKSPPHYQRYLIAAPAVCLLIGRAAVVALRRMTRLWGWRPVVRRRLVAFLAVTLLAINAGYYFVVYAPGGAFAFDRNTEIADRAARLMVELGPDYRTYFFCTSMRLGGFNSVRFLAPRADWMDVEESPPADWTFVEEGRGAHFILLPEREDELPLLQERFPDGEEREVDGRDGRILFIVYQVPPGRTTGGDSQ
ncbi:MAG: glycosyltransferase family 39 protein, partial [Chloroflexi bacterium]|nr:glycosyltransferase family 39 protein [Chloroflexota bacterium]